MNPVPPQPSPASFRLVTFHPSLKPFFFSINCGWLEEYFSVTPEDEKQLRHPEAIVEGGGQIFFVLDDETPVGTCALVRSGPSTFELAKMGVVSSYRKKGVGQLLMDAALSYATEKKAAWMTLETAAVLKPAIQLYQRNGFIREGGEYIHPLFGRRIFRMKRRLHS